MDLDMMSWLCNRIVGCNSSNPHDEMMHSLISAMTWVI